MTGTFLDMYTRITTELRRSNATADVKQAINDAIFEASQERFYFNETTDMSFNTVNGQEYYPDLGFVEIDAAWWLNGSTRYNIDVVNNDVMDELADGNVINGQLLSLSHTAGQLRLYPIPSSVFAVHLTGFGAILTPSPLVNDADTNAWMVAGEQYIRALAKRNYLRDIVRDYGEARVYDTMAEEYKGQLVERTAIKSSGSSTIKATAF